MHRTDRIMWNPAPSLALRNMAAIHTIHLDLWQLIPHLLRLVVGETG